METTTRILTWFGLVLFVHVSIIVPYFDQNAQNNKIGQTQVVINSILKGYSQILTAELKSKTPDPVRIRESREKIVIWNEKHLMLEKSRQRSEFEIPVLGIKVPRSTMIVFYPFLIVSGLIYISLSRKSWLRKKSVASEGIPFWVYPLSEPGNFLQNNMVVILHGLPIIWLIKFLLDIHSRTSIDGEKVSLVILMIGLTMAIYIQSFYRKEGV